MISRQQFVDARHHVVPVKQQVDRHHRHDHEQHHDIDDTRRRTQHRVQQFAATRFDGFPNRDQGLPQRAFGVHQVGEAFDQEIAQIGEQRRRHVEEVQRLIDQ